MRRDTPRTPSLDLDAAPTDARPNRASLGRRGRPQLLILMVALITAPACAGNRVADGPPLQLHRTEFTYNSPAKQPVYDWFSLDPAFVAVVEQHPPSLVEARKAAPYRTATWVTAIAASGFVIKSAISAIDDADALTADDEVWTTDYTIAAALGVGAVVFDAFARRYLNRSVSLFNANVTRTGGDAGAAGLPTDGDAFRLEFAPTYRPGVGAGLVGRIPLR